MKKSRILSIALVGTFMVGLLAACAPAAPEAPQATAPPLATQQAPGNEPTPAPADAQRGLTIAVRSETPSVAPARHTASEGHFKNCLTHNGLFRLDSVTLEPVPDLVESWRSISDTVFEFTLHEGIMFHNGEEMTAYDVVASLEYVRTYPIATVFHGSVVGSEVVDRYTFTIDTGTPNAMLFFELAFQANFIMPASLIEAGHDFTAEPIGSGPFVFYNWNFGDSLTFHRFDNYFDTNRQAHLDYVHWRIIPEGAQRTIALENDEVDYVVEVALPDVSRLRDNDAVTVLEHQTTRFSYILLNNELPQFENVYVRRALDMALDKEAMLMASLEGFGEPTWQLMPPVFAGSSATGSRSFDPDGARAILAEQGVDPAELAFVLTVYSEEDRRRAEVVQANLNDIGVPITIAMVDFAAWLDMTRDGTFDAATGAFTASNMLMFMRSTMHIDSIPAPNRSKIRNLELSELISEAIATIDPTSRIATLEEASRVANEHAGFIPTNTNVVVRAFNSNLVVPEVSATGFMLHLNMAYWTN